MTTQNSPWQDIRYGNRSYFLGKRLAVSGASSSQDTTINFPSIFLGFDYTASAYSDTDSFTVSITGGNTILDIIYIKNAGEAFRIERPLVLLVNSIVHVVFTNTSGVSKTFWYNLEFARSD